MGIDQPVEALKEAGRKNRSIGVVDWRPPAGALPGGGCGELRQSAPFTLDWAQCEAPLLPSACDAIVSLCQTFDPHPTTVVDERGLPQHRVGLARLVPDTPEAQPIYRLLWTVAAEAARRRFDFEISGITRMPQFVEYSAGYGHFHWHDDYSHESPTAPRKLTIVIQLSEADAYEGGDLEIFGVGPLRLPRNRGALLCFPSFIPHRVTPVTFGVRKVVVAWIAGPRIR